MLECRKKHLWSQRYREGGIATYNTYALKVKRSIEQYHAKKERSLIESKSQKKFFAFMNSKLKGKSGLSFVVNKIGEHITDNQQMATCLNEFFCQNFSMDDGTVPVFNQRVRNNCQFSNPNFDCLAVKKL